MKTGVLVFSTVLVILGAASSDAKQKPDERLRNVNSIFVKGNSQAADRAREMLREGKKTCFSLASKPEDADAVLEIGDSAVGSPGLLGGMGARHNVVSGTLTLSSGDLIWSHSARFSDAPFMSGAKTAADILLSSLAKDAACKDRKK